MLGSDLRNIWDASRTTDRDRKELLRTLLEEVIIKVNRVEYNARLTMRALRRNSNEPPFYAAFLNATNSTLVAAIRCAFNNK
jgi:hypothetical protein